MIGALVTGVLFATTEDTMAGSAAVERESAMITVEAAIATVVADVSTPLPASIGVSGTRFLSTDVHGQTVTVCMTRLDSTLVFIAGEAIGNRSRSAARRPVGILASI